MKYFLYLWKEQCMAFGTWLANTALDRKRVKDACKASNLSKEEKTLLVLCKVLWRKEADEEISLTLQGHTGILKYNYPAAAADLAIRAPSPGSGKARVTWQAIGKHASGQGEGRHLECHKKFLTLYKLKWKPLAGRKFKENSPPTARNMKGFFFWYLL